MITRIFWETTFYFGLAVILFLALSPLIVYIASKNEKNISNRVLYIAIAFIADCGLISWFLMHIHHFGLSLPYVIRCYIDYFRNNPH